jgi:hypothetical protein
VVVSVGEGAWSHEALAPPGTTSDGSLLCTTKVSFVMASWTTFSSPFAFGLRQKAMGVVVLLACAQVASMDMTWVHVLTLHEPLDFGRATLISL